MCNLGIMIIHFNCKGDRHRHKAGTSSSFKHLMIATLYSGKFPPATVTTITVQSSQAKHCSIDVPCTLHSRASKFMRPPHNLLITC